MISYVPTKPIDIVSGDLALNIEAWLSNRGERCGDLACVIDNPFFGPLTDLAVFHEFVALRNWHWNTRDLSPQTYLGACDDVLVDAQDIRVWIGPTVCEGLTAVAAIERLQRLGVARDRIRLIDATDLTLPIGVSRLADLAGLEEPERITPKMEQALSRAWTAFTSSDPKHLALYAQDQSLLGFLRRTARALVRLYPDRSSGLGLLESRALAPLSSAWRPAVDAVITALDVSHQDPDGAWLGDLSLFECLKELSHRSLEAPLLEMRMAHDDPARIIDPRRPLKNMANTEVRLTRHGEACLAGELNHVGVNGIERWVAGVYLTSRGGNVWFRDGEDLVPA
ncbi:MAG: hypothetical protein AAGH74_06985 [Pseudomonadota bacterium]